MNKNEKKIIDGLLRFLISLNVPTAVFCVVAIMIPMLSTPETHTFIGISMVLMTTYLLISFAIAINVDIGEAMFSSFGILVVATIVGGILISFVAYEVIGPEALKEGEFKVPIALICGCALSVFVWIYNLIKDQQLANLSRIESEDEELLRGWYILNGNSFTPVLAFEEGRRVTFTDGKIVEEYVYHICCSTCLILTAEDGKKAYIQRYRFSGKPHLFYNGLEFVKD